MPLLATLVLSLAIRPSGADRFRFVVYGDCRDGHDIHRKIVALTMEQKPAFVIQTGDLVHRGNQDDLWKIYDDITGEMRKKIPLYPAPGNHDFGGTGYQARFNLATDSGNKMYYSFTRGRWHFVTLAVDEHMAYDSASDQYKWLETELAKARKANQDIAVSFHVPPYSIGSHGSNMDVRSALCPLFEKFGVALVLNGHDHIYYRTIRNGITYIVTGGGGAPLYPTDPNKGALPEDKWISANHLVVLDVDGDRVHGKMLKVDGSVFDTFEVTARSAASRLNNLVAYRRLPGAR